MPLKLTALTLAALAVAFPLNAQPSQSQTAKVNALWLIAIDDWGPLFTCGATNADSDEFIRNAWSKTRKRALEAMAGANWPKDDLARWQSRSEPDAMRLPLDTPFAKVIAYCSRRKDWVEHSFKVDMLPIGAEVEKILKPVTVP
ncbi:hypothetical protein D2N39_07775 [Gemmobacter lutimaris]|uniref:Secreted protein n=1 Tax=Gemmobacter lutimaris TaxID=2306023 RepID=A0A398BVM8_9RHOB|nr:hypothetical protein [Gemmobacter lutimaris]RID92528.1 hypothetical protein D2N39_07775 [Gemmobacter lutimaris]